MKNIQQSKWDWQKLWTYIRDNASLPIESKTKSIRSIIVKVPQSKKYLKDMVRAKKKT
jgi:hypothetical protein